MFDLIFNALSAVNQAAALLAALVCWGLGGLLVGSAVYWRLHAVRVQGEVIGVRRNGNCFNAVYRYVTPSGQRLEATSLEGSSTTSGKETGTQVPLLMIPDKPTEVQEARSHIFTLIGVVLLAVGAGILYYTVRSWRAGPMTWIVAGLFIAHLLHGLRRIVTPKDKSLRSLSLRDLISRKQAAAMDASPVTRVEDLAEDPGIHAHSAQRATLRRFAPLFLLVGLGLLALGVHQSRTLLRLESSGMRAPGVISGFSASRSSSGITYYPVVTYQDASGRSIVFKDHTGTNPPLYRSGEAITVLYLPAESGSAIIDRGLWNWLPSLLLYLFGAGLIALSLGLLRSPRAAEPVLGTSS
jgi:hypothetical protein